MRNILLYTAEGLKKLREELDYLKSVMRPKASAYAEARIKATCLKMQNTMLPKKHKEC
jgi:transcription elongation GreA/GreB family factor